MAMRIMRHSQIAIAVDVYANVPSEETRGASKRLGENLRSRLLLHMGRRRSLRKIAMGF
jgi:hypothetical protein